MQNRKDRSQAKVVRTNKDKPEDAGHFSIIGKTSRKVLKNQDSGVTDVFAIADRKGGASRTNRSGK